MEALLAVWMVGLVGLHRAQGYDDGAPADVCTTMLPDHGTNTLTGTPYSIVTNSSTFTTGTKVNVTIVGTFKGYFLQARIPDNTTIVGTWDTPPTGNKFVQCNSVANAAVTHSTSTSKTNLSFYWIPPTTSPPSSVVFVATVVKTKQEWQINVQSAKVNASGYVATTTAKPGNSAGRSALAMSGLSLGALLVVVTAACCR
ncbi:putative ferric-chelate reductase 1 isoform X2 [Lethenteron reissneri]|uniref:putative ferric-chelate reductase 1 isoform X2 n=1 Tax=Lethenteron reissneri TaxID=7753 RepID=UPI002AB6A767|nr:putative ferric-chelate reductase 1 isoform X2 [Lethenteron reissneri]